MKTLIIKGFEKLDRKKQTNKHAPASVLPLTASRLNKAV